MVSGCSWVTFFFPPIAKVLEHFNMAPGILAELTLTLWFLIKGIDSQRWGLQASQQ